jgi:tetratricopeptide (TPR) repeat protein
VLIFGSTTCPCADGYNPRIDDLARRFDGEGVRTFMVFSAPEATRKAVEEYAAKRKISLPLVLDAGGKLAARLNARTTPTAVVIDAAGKVQYRGRIDDNPDPQAMVRQDLKLALEELLAGKKVQVARTLAIGCGIGGEKADAGKAVALEEGLGKVDFKVTTQSPQAQKFFNQGLNRWYGFNFPEAEKAFREAARLDPECAMAYWGIALSLGMSYNVDFSPDRIGEAEAAIAKAMTLVEKTSPREQAFIRALSKRHSANTVKDLPALLEEYRREMGKVFYTRPNDADAAVLFAASLMDLRPWALWSRDGRPQPGTMEAIMALETAMRLDPDHIGAHHYYIHATEASPNPERAIPSAKKLGALAPRSGHLVHMPSHTYIRTGDFFLAAATNRQASNVDDRYFTGVGKGTAYSGYYIHNLDFLVASHMLAGRYDEAAATSRELSAMGAKYAPEIIPLFCGGPSGIMAVYERFGKWDEILKAPAPPAENPFMTHLWHYARGMAQAARGNTAEAEKELAILDQMTPEVVKAVPEVPNPGLTEGIRQALKTAHLALAGRVAFLKKDNARAVELYRQAIREEDAIPFTEPPLWRHPVRELLGSLYLQTGRLAEAETVFREALVEQPGSGRAHFGLWKALEAQKKPEAAAAKAAFDKAWARATTQLTVEGL